MKTALFPFCFLFFEIFDQIKLTLLFMKFLVSHLSTVYICLILDTFFLVLKRAVITWFSGVLIMAHCEGQPDSLPLWESPGQLPTCPNFSVFSSLALPLHGRHISVLIFLLKRGLCSQFIGY